MESTNTSSTDGYGWWLDVGVPNATISLSDKLGLDWEDTCQEFYRRKNNVYTASVAQVRKPIYQSPKR